MLNFVYLRSSTLYFLHFWLDSCIINKGENFELVFGLLDAFRRFSGGFEPFLDSGVHRSDRLRSPVWPVKVLVLCTCSTGLTGQTWADVAALFSSSGLHAFVQGELHWFRGSMCARGALCGFSSFGLVVCALCLSIVLPRMCRVVALA
jgi:hypothetical protein